MDFIIGALAGWMLGRRKEPEQQSVSATDEFKRVWQESQERQRERTARIERWSATLPLARFSLNPRVRRLAREMKEARNG
jgi:hypothetical protein